MNNKERNYLKGLQNRFLNHVLVRSYIKREGKQRPIFENGPCYNELKKELYPEYKEKMKQILMERLLNGMF